MPVLMSALAATGLAGIHWPPWRRRAEPGAGRAAGTLKGGAAVKWAEFTPVRAAGADGPGVVTG